MPKTLKSANVHRFRDLVAVCLPGSGETAYFTPSEALALARHIGNAARDIKARDFGYSQFASVEMPLPPEVLIPGRAYDHAKRRKS